MLASGACPNACVGTVQLSESSVTLHEGMQLCERKLSRFTLTLMNVERMSPP